MFDKKINTRIVNKHAREADWLASTLIPLCGELIIYDKEVDSDGNVIKPERVKIGDGVSSANDLAFIASQPVATDEEVMEILFSYNVITPISDSTGYIYLDADQKILTM